MKSESSICNLIRNNRMYNRRMKRKSITFNMGKENKAIIFIRTNFMYNPFTDNLNVTHNIVYMHKTISPLTYGKRNCKDEECKDKIENYAYKHNKKRKDYLKRILLTETIGKELRKTITTSVLVTYNQEKGALFMTHTINFYDHHIS